MLEQISLLDSNELYKYIQINKHMPINKIFKVISLFSGCGGMDLGFRGDFTIFNEYFEKNGFEIVFANDIVQKACETYMYNFKHEAMCLDINDLDCSTLPKADIVVGGFPCQDFSLAGKRKGLDADRGRLYLQMKRVIDHVKPLAFVAENVDGIRISAKGTDTSALDVILDDFRESGYNVAYQLLNSADYGVPQIRKRVIIIGIKKESNIQIYFPSPVRNEDDQTKPWMTAKEAIDDLWDRVGDDNIYNHTLKDISKAKFYPGKRMQGNNKIFADRPSCTIRSEHHGNIEAHYRTFDESDAENMETWRRLSVRECARLQSFPDDFIFPCAASSAYKQIGNAVPPIMAWYIARSLYKSLNG